MKKILILTCGILMASHTLQAEVTDIPCANGAGVIYKGEINKKEYCLSNKQMNWWNAYTWCDGIGMTLFTHSDDCGWSETIGYNKPDCPNIKTGFYVWTATPVQGKHSTFYRISDYGDGRDNGDGAYPRYYTAYVLCESK